MTAADRSELIEQRLRERLDAVHVQVVDDSLRHAEHLGAAAGGGHFLVRVVSSRFDGLSRVAAQRLVYDALGDLMQTEIHALQMQTLTPADWAEQQDD